MLWMREARIRTYMQLELEACQKEIVWMIRCHNCETLNRPQEEYPARPLPVPPNYIDNLHSGLIKVHQGVWPPTLKMILKTRYNLPPPTTSPRTVQPDGVMRGHRGGKNSPQEQPRAPEETEENVCLPCVLFCLFFPCVLSAPYCVCFLSCPQIAEAGTKRDMSYLDAPDA